MTLETTKRKAVTRVLLLVSSMSQQNIGVTFLSIPGRSNPIVARCDLTTATPEVVTLDNIFRDII